MLHWLRKLKRQLLDAWHARGGSDPYEHPIVAGHRKWTHRTGSAFVLAFGAVILGVWAEFGSETLEEDLRAARANITAAFRGSSLDPLWPPAGLFVAFFGFCLVVFAYVLWKRLQADDQKQEERTLDILRALYGVPNISVVQQYPEQFWPRFLDLLQNDWPSTDLPLDERKYAMSYAIRDALALIAEMAHRFSRAEKARYGANVMLIIARREELQRPFPENIVRALRFHSRGALDDLAGLLYLPRDLLVANIPAADERHIPLIALPVPYSERDDHRHRLVIPGAPTAIITGELSVHEDTRLIAHECEDFSAPVRTAISHYFSPDGDGRDVLSFASVRLGDDVNPIGVLNIDSDHTNVLGLHDQFYISFYALVRPMLDLLATAVAEYAKLIAPDLHLLDVEPTQDLIEPGAAVPEADVQS